MVLPDPAIQRFCSKVEVFERYGDFRRQPVNRIAECASVACQSTRETGPIVEAVSTVSAVEFSTVCSSDPTLDESSPGLCNLGQ